VNVKAQGLLNAALFVRERFGESALDRVLAKCTPSTREHALQAIAINWVPFEELAEILRVVDQELGAGDGNLAEAIGAASARVNLRHLALRLAFFLARPEFLMRRVAGVWRQYNEAGEMAVLEFNPGRMVAELRAMPVTDWIVCASVTGWLHEAGVATGMKHLQTMHSECRGKGAARCLWLLKWSAGASTAREEPG
jgi:hypothetical protein